MAYQSVNSNTGEVLKSFEHLSKAQLEKSLATAESAFRRWKHKSFAERAVVLNKAAASMHAQVDDFAKLATLEMGKCIDEARGEVKFSGDILACYAKNAEAFCCRPGSTRRSARPRWKAACSACCSASGPGTFCTTSWRAWPARS